MEASPLPQTNGSVPGLQERLRDPRTAAALHRLLDRLDALDQTVAALTTAVERAPALLATATDAFDEACRQADRAGVDLEQRLAGVQTLAERLTAPRTVAALAALLDRLDRLTALLALLDQLPAALATAVDSLDEVAREVAAEGLDLERAVLQGAGAALRFGARMGPSQLDAVDALLSSGVLDPAAVRVVAGAGRALAASQDEAPPPAGPLDLLRALRDPDVRHALGFTLQFARHFGRALRTSRPA